MTSPPFSQSRVRGDLCSPLFRSLLLDLKADSDRPPHRPLTPSPSLPTLRFAPRPSSHPPSRAPPVVVCRKNFERHFQESRHAFGMRALGLPNTKHFHEITKIEDAIARTFFSFFKTSSLSSLSLSPLVLARFADARARAHEQSPRSSSRKEGPSCRTPRRPRNSKTRRAMCTTAKRTRT